MLAGFRGRSGGDGPDLGPVYEELNGGNLTPNDTPLDARISASAALSPVPRALTPTLPRVSNHSNLLL
ncbi:hypothetical protein BR93DRAFT_924878, partial [Coniochaeta sp. PMI_546]